MASSILGGCRGVKFRKRSLLCGGAPRIGTECGVYISKGVGCGGIFDKRIGCSFSRGKVSSVCGRLGVPCCGRAAFTRVGGCSCGFAVNRISGDRRCGGGYRVFR